MNLTIAITKNVLRLYNDILCNINENITQKYYLHTIIVINTFYNYLYLNITELSTINNSG